MFNIFFTKRFVMSKDRMNPIWSWYCWKTMQLYHVIFMHIIHYWSVTLISAS